MVVYNVLCADLSSDFLDFIPGDIIEEKLITLQEKLGENFPDIILQYLCDDENRIVQIKGNWDDIQSVHTVLESWMSGCDIPLNSEIPDEFAEKVEGIAGGVFFDKGKKSNDDTEKAGQNSDIQMSNVGEGAENCAEQNDFVKLEQNSPNAKQNKSSKRTPTKSESHGLPDTVTRSGRVVKKAFTVRELYPEKCEDDESSNLLPDSDALSEYAESEEQDYDVENTTDLDAEELNQASADGFKLNKKPAQGSNIRHIAEQTPQDNISGEHEAKVVCEKRGRKRKSLTKIPLEEVSNSVEEAAAAAASPNEISCLLCDFKTNAKRHLKCHLIRCHVSGKFVCKLCKNRSYSLEKDLRAHMKSHYPKLSCNQCDRRFPTKTLRDLHVTKFHEIGEKKRLRREERNLPSKCEHCDHVAENDRNMRDHFARHHSEKVFTCPVCCKGFGLKKDMVAHEKTHTTVFYCEQCGKALRSKGALKLHVDSIHRGIKKVMSKPVICDHCGETCRNSTHYKEHVNKDHLHVKPFGCPLCPMAFYTNNSLKQHLLTHTDSKKHVCSKCGKVLKSANSLRVHLISHMEYSDRPYACTQCSKTFSQRGALVRHLRIHTGEKPYKCRLCDSAFTDYSILRRHMLGVHKVNNRNLCQRADVPGNKGGPKPERIKVENIIEYKNIIRSPKEAENDLKKIQISEEDIALIKSHAVKVEEQMKLKENMQIRIANANDKIYTSLEDTSQSASYVIHDQSLDRDANYVVTDLTPHLTQDISASTGYTVLQSNDPVNVAHDLAYPNIPFSVQHITGHDGQNISIQILQSTQDSASFFVEEKT